MRDAPARIYTPLNPQINSTTTSSRYCDCYLTPQNGGCYIRADLHTVAIKELVDELKYARRFLKKEDADTDAIDGVIQKYS